jgi:hypothetical protein
VVGAGEVGDLGVVRWEHTAILRHPH